MVLTVTAGSLAMAVIRVIFMGIDSVVYWALTCIYNLLTDIASVNLFGPDGAGEFGTRIYTIIGVIMLFKLAFSVLTYIIDPDKMTDNKNGFGTIVKDIVVMFVLIVTVPMIFKAAMGLQYLILEDDTIGRLVTGHHGGDYGSMGDRLSSTILLTFIHPNEEYFDKCNGIMSSSDELYQDCLGQLNPYPDIRAQYEQVFNGTTMQRQHILALAFKTEKINGHTDEFVITYRFIVSTLVGAFTAYVLLLFCIDIATRTVKLAFLQLIAPIPIVAYMDEKGKNGIFKKWVDACKSTYLDLFVRLAGIDFAIYLISEFIFNNQAKICHWELNGTTLSSYGCRTPGPFVSLFMILGVLMFAKELPKLIEEITGLKLGGKFDLNPLKKLGASPALGAAVGAIGGGIGAAIGNNYAARKNGWSAERRRLSTAAGLFGGAGRGFLAGVGGKNADNPFKNATSAIRGVADARNLRDQRNKDGVGGLHGVGLRTAANLSNLVGVDSGATLADKKVAAADEYLKMQKAADDLMEAEILKGKDNFSAVGQGVLNAKNLVDVLKTSALQAGESQADRAAKITQAEIDYKAAMKAAKQQYYDMDPDGYMQAYKANLTDIINQNKDNDLFYVDRDMTNAIINANSGSAWDASKGVVTGSKNSYTSSDEYHQLMREKKATEAASGKK